MGCIALARCVLVLRCGLAVVVWDPYAGFSPHTDTTKPSGHYIYRHFNNQQFYVLPTQCIYVFCVDLRTNSDYFPIQH